MFDHLLRELYPRPLRIGPRAQRTVRLSALLLASALEMWWGAGSAYIRHQAHLPVLTTWGGAYGQD